MAKRKRLIPDYSTVTLNGVEYYRTRIEDADGKRVALYARTPEELYDKETEALEQIGHARFHRKSPTVAEYCEKWLLMQSVHVRQTTLTDYTSKVRRHIIKELGEMRMADVTLDDIQLALVPVSKKSASVYKAVVILYKSIFRAAKKTSTSDYVVANRDGGPLSYTQFKRLWQYIVTRTAKPRVARKLVDGKYVKYILYPQLGEKARNNGHCVYSLDFEVTPHQLRHTYITNLIHSSVDPKTVQYLAGHESSKITMDIYAKVKYNQPDQVVKAMGGAFSQWDAMWA